MRLNLWRLMVIVASLGFLSWFIRPAWVYVPRSIEPPVFIVVTSALLFAKLVGSVWVGRRLILGRGLLAGEWIWFVSAATFVLGVCLFASGEVHGPWVDLYLVMAVVLVTELIAGSCLAAFGRRPGPDDPAWAHYAGWLSLGADALYCGLIARS